MEQNKKEELRTISECLCVKSEEGQTSDGQSVERYKHLAEQIKHSPALNDAILEQSILLMKQGRYCEAIQLFENRLSQNPRDLDALGRWNKTRADTHKHMVTLAKSAPETAEYGRTYEKLIQTGFAGSVLHLGAVRHYLICGQLERAVSILLSLAQSAPGAPGVIDAILKVAAMSDDARVQQLKVTITKEQI